MKSAIRISAVLMVLGLAGCQGGDKPNIELIQDMMDSPALKAQEYDEDSPNHAAMRVPADGTVPVGFTPYPYRKGDDAIQKASANKNPIAGDMGDEVIFTGMKMYETNCTVCHGAKGQGGEESGSTVSALMARKPPTLLSDRVRNMTDGDIYHIITMGLGVMGPYDSHIPQNLRWQVVNYVRHLQKNAK